MQLTPQEAETLLYDWKFWAREKQLPPPGHPPGWVILAGRGNGKTRTGAEWVRYKQETGSRRIAIVGRTAADVRDVMVEGESGIMAISPPWNRPKYEPSRRRLTWPNGAIATTYTGDEPDQLRGPQHDAAWADELAAWRYAEDAWSNIQFGLRLGDLPQWLATTTPRRIPLIKELLQDERIVITRGSTYDNRANLAASFFTNIIRKYEGTRLGRQELDGVYLDDVPGALWNSLQLQELRVRKTPPLKRVVVSVDPAVSNNEGSAETGITVEGLGTDGHGYVLEDVTVKGSPLEWANAAITAYYKYKADRIIAEANNGGNLVEANIRAVDNSVPVKLVHASRGKLTRAEPVSALYERQMVHHVGMFAELEDQMTTWLPGDTSPDRMDAVVWGLTELMLDKNRSARRGLAPAALGQYRG